MLRYLMNDGCCKVKVGHHCSHGVHVHQDMIPLVVADKHCLKHGHKCRDRKRIEKWHWIFGEAKHHHALNARWVVETRCNEKGNRIQGVDVRISAPCLEGRSEERKREQLKQRGATLGPRATTNSKDSRHIFDNRPEHGAMHKDQKVMTIVQVHPPQCDAVHFVEVWTPNHGAKKEQNANVLPFCNTSHPQLNLPSPVLLPLCHVKANHGYQEKRHVDSVTGSQAKNSTAENTEAAHGNSITSMVKKLPQRSGVLRSSRLLSIQSIQCLIEKHCKHDKHHTWNRERLCKVVRFPRSPNGG